MKTFKHVEHPEIPAIKQVNANGARHYETPFGVYISITTMLHKLPLTPELAKWREDVGDDVANYAMMMGARRGNKLHSAVESYLKNKPLQDMKQS